MQEDEDSSMRPSPWHIIYLLLGLSPAEVEWAMDHTLIACPALICSLVPLGVSWQALPGGTLADFSKTTNNTATMCFTNHDHAAATSAAQHLTAGQQLVSMVPQKSNSHCIR